MLIAAVETTDTNNTPSIIIEAIKIVGNAKPFEGLKLFVFLSDEPISLTQLPHIINDFSIP